MRTATRRNLDRLIGATLILGSIAFAGGCSLYATEHKRADLLPVPYAASALVLVLGWKRMDRAEDIENYKI